MSGSNTDGHGGDYTERVLGAADGVMEEMAKLATWIPGGHFQILTREAIRRGQGLRAEDIAAEVLNAEAQRLWQAEIDAGANPW